MGDWIGDSDRSDRVEQLTKLWCDFPEYVSPEVLPHSAYISYKYRRESPSDFLIGRHTITKIILLFFCRCDRTRCLLIHRFHPFTGYFLYYSLWISSAFVSFYRFFYSLGFGVEYPHFNQYCSIVSIPFAELVRIWKTCEEKYGLKSPT